MQPRTKDEVPIPAPRPTEVAPQNEALEKTLKELGEEPGEAPKQADIVTVDFTKFMTRTVSFAGTSWDFSQVITTRTKRTLSGIGHGVTRVVWPLVVLKSSVSLADRTSPTARPLAPVSSTETLASVGLDDASALELASQCLWLDEATFRPGDFEISEDRKKQAEDSTATLRGGWVGCARAATYQGKNSEGFHFPIARNLCKADTSASH